MSHSSDESQKENRPGQWGRASLDREIPQAALIKNLLWVVAGIAVGVAVAMNYELVWELLSESVPLLFEFIEKALDTFFERVLGLGPGIAQMATAYIGFVTLLVMSYFLVRKTIKFSKRAKVSMAFWRAAYANAGRRWWEARRAATLRWWESLSLADKIVAIIALVLIGIPVALLLSIALGTAVAALL